MYILFCLLYCFCPHCLQYNLFYYSFFRMFLLLYPRWLLHEFVYCPTPTNISHIFTFFYSYFLFSPNPFFLISYLIPSCHILLLNLLEYTIQLLSASYYLHFIFISCQFTSHFVPNNVTIPHAIFSLSVFFPSLLIYSILSLVEHPDITKIDLS